MFSCTREGTGSGTDGQKNADSYVAPPNPPNLGADDAKTPGCTRATIPREIQRARVQQDRGTQAKSAKPSARPS